MKATDRDSKRRLSTKPQSAAFAGDFGRSDLDATRGRSLAHGGTKSSSFHERKP